MRKIPIFIVGYPRSGTTLLMAMLGAHPEITLFNEPMLIKDMREWGVGFKDFIEGQRKVELLDKLRRRHHVATIYEELLENYAGSREAVSFKETYEKLLPVPEKNKIWGEKTPSNLLYMEELYDLYPQALFIHITREPGAVLLSHYYKKIAVTKTQPVELNNRTLEFLARHAIRWALLMELAEKAELNIDSANFLRIKYEDLLAFPEALMRTICEKIGVQYDHSLLDEKSRRANKILPPGTGHAHALLDKPLEISRAHAGKSIPSWMRYIINKYAGEMLKRIGYESGSVRPSVVENCYVDLALFLQKKKIHRRITGQLESWGVEMSKLISTSFFGSLILSWCLFLRDIKYIIVNLIIS